MRKILYFFNFNNSQWINLRMLRQIVKFLWSVSIFFVCYIYFIGNLNCLRQVSIISSMDSCLVHLVKGISGYCLSTVVELEFIHVQNNQINIVLPVLISWDFYFRILHTFVINISLLPYKWWEIFASVVQFWSGSCAVEHRQ